MILCFDELDEFFYTSVDIFPLFPDQTDLLLNGWNDRNAHQTGKILHERRIKKGTAQFVLKEILNRKELTGMHDYVRFDSGSVEMDAQGGILNRIRIV